MEETTPTSTSSQNNRRIAKNTLMLYFRMILIMSVSLYTSRVVLNTLGIEDFGIYNIVGGVISLFTFFNTAMRSATQRFLSYEIGRNDFIQLKKTFNASQIIHVGIAVIIFIITETIGLWFLKNHLVIPIERMEAAVSVFHFSVLSFMLTIVQVPYNASIIAREKMNIYAYVSILEVVLKLLIVFMLKWITYDKLILFGLLNLIVVLLITGIYRIYTHQKILETKFELVYDKKLYKTLITYSGWNLFGSISGIVKVQGVDILLNIFFGPVLNAARGIATQVMSAVHSFVSNFQMAVNPQIVKSYAKDENDYMFSLIFRSAKFSFYLVYLISLPIILEANQILKIWLVKIPEYTTVFTILSIILVSFWPISNPLMTAVQATGRIKLYQLVTGILMILTLPITFLFFNKDFSPVSTYYIAIVIEISALIIRLYFVRKLLNFPIMAFIKDIILKNILIVIISLTLPLIIRNIMDENLRRLLLVGFVALFWNAFVIFSIGLKKSEKAIFFRVVDRITKKVLIRE